MDKNKIKIRKKLTTLQTNIPQGNRMKNSRILSSIALILTISLSSFPKNSHAVITVAGGGAPGTYILPMAILGIGGLAITGGPGPLVGLGMNAIILGLILLDESHHSEFAPKFQSISDTVAHQKGLSLSEQQAFNNELDEFSLVTEQIAFALTEMPNATVQEANQLWLQYVHEGIISSEAFSAAQKLLK